MIIQYGTHAFTANSVRFVLQVDTAEDDRRRRLYENRSVTLDGWVTGLSSSALKTAMDSIETALETENQDLLVYQDDGETLLETLLDASATTDGVMVDGPSFPNADGAEYATFRSWKATLTGRYTIPGADRIISFEERVDVQDRDGNSTRVLIELREHHADLQEVTKHPVCTITQSGTIVGTDSYPAIPPPKWPGQTYSRRFSQFKRGTDRAGDPVEYGISYTYSFELFYEPVIGQVRPESWRDA